jgi:hypothetical protein
MVRDSIVWHCNNAFFFDMRWINSFSPTIWFSKNHIHKTMIVYGRKFTAKLQYECESSDDFLLLYIDDNFVFCH